MTNIQQMADRIGEAAYLTIEDIKVFKNMKFQVSIIGARTSYGRAEYLIKPVSGEGQTWVTDKRLVFQGEKNENRNTE